MPTPHENPDAWVPRLSRVLDRQADLYVQLSALCDEQSAAVASGATDELLGVLSRRQVVIEQIAGLNGELAPFQGVWVEQSSALPERHREAIRERMARLDGLMSSIRARDDADRRELERRRTVVGAELNSAARAGQAAAAYGAARGAGDTAARFQDRKG
ncbi:MAG: flagellar export chaperone FlgN [Phycisphaerales bacterium]|nr:flagellar export chaperone FlgN [Phycisphaerales bacterium]